MKYLKISTARSQRNDISPRKISNETNTLTIKIQFKKFKLTILIIIISRILAALCNQ